MLQTNFSYAKACMCSRSIGALSKSIAPMVHGFYSSNKKYKRWSQCAMCGQLRNKILVSRALPGPVEAPFKEIKEF